ncbi:MAG: hypothetical protein Q8R40_03765, partial [bacterium]|nr:hypothetical protein [bacterium]
MDKTDIPGTFNAGATLGPVNETNMARIGNKHKQPFDPAQGKANTPLKRKVFVAMSGGVDSSVAAALLKKAGFDVVGIYMKQWSDPVRAKDRYGFPVAAMHCAAQTDAEDARRVAEALGIPFYVWDFEAEYKERVAQHTISEYAAGRTPNPDVLC